MKKGCTSPSEPPQGLRHGGTGAAPLPWTVEKSGAVLLRIKVEPRSSRPGPGGILGDTLKIRLAAPPVDGKANRELTSLLARELGIRKDQIELVGGLGSRMKTVRLSGVDLVRLARLLDHS